MAHVSARARKINPVGNAKLVYWRQPFDPTAMTPAVVQDALAGWGGTNEYGEPLWRVIDAQQHLVLRDGIWENRDESRDSVNFEGQNQRTGAMSYTTQKVAPESITKGPTWVPLYPCQGWILERWFPAYCYGSPEAWEAVKSSDGITPMMGPFPSRGAYWWMKGPWQEMPALTQFRMGISSWENSTKHLHGRLDQLDMELYQASMALFLKHFEEEEEANYNKTLEHVKSIRMPIMRDWITNPNLTAEKNRILNSRGLTSHF